MGNRGCLHDAAGRIVRAHVGQRWILCRLAFKGRRRTVMTPGRYTELFFLDEATALAAGHRPCAECMRPRFELFRQTWAAANLGLSRGKLPSAVELDRALHSERLAGRQRASYPARLGDLPPGVFVAATDGDTPYLVGQDRLWRWSFTGYTSSSKWDAEQVVRVVTPRSVAAALAAGYPVQVHPTATAPTFSHTL